MSTKVWYVLRALDISKLQKNALIADIYPIIYLETSRTDSLNQYVSVAAGKALLPVQIVEKIAAVLESIMLVKPFAANVQREMAHPLSVPSVNAQDAGTVLHVAKDVTGMNPQEKDMKMALTR